MMAKKHTDGASKKSREMNRKKDRKGERRETLVKSKSKFTRGRSGDSQSTEPRQTQKQWFAAQKGYHPKSGSSSSTKPTKDYKPEDRSKQEAGLKSSAEELDKFEFDDPTGSVSDTPVEAPTEAPADEISGASDVLTDPNDSRYQYQVLSDGKIKIVAAPEDTGFTGMILDDPDSKAHKAIMEVFKSGGKPSAGLDAATSDLPEQEPPLETPPPDADDPPQGEAPETQYLPSGEEGLEAHRKWAEQHDSVEQVVPGEGEQEPMPLAPEGLGSRALDDEAILASATDAARMAKERETHVPMNPEDKPKYAGTTSDREDNLRRLREMYKAEGIETVPNLTESPPAVDDTVAQYEYNLPPQSMQPDYMGRNRAVEMAWEKDRANRKSVLDEYRGDFFDESGLPRAGRFPVDSEFYKPEDRLGAENPKDVLDEYRGDFFDESGTPKAGRFPVDSEFYKPEDRLGASAEDPMGRNRAVETAFQKQQLLDSLSGRPDDQAFVVQFLAGKQGQELIEAMRTVQSHMFD